MLVTKDHRTVKSQVNPVVSVWNYRLVCFTTFFALEKRIIDVRALQTRGIRGLKDPFVRKAPKDKAYGLPLLLEFNRP